MMDFKDLVQKYNHLAESAIKVVVAPDLFLLSQVDKALLYVLAPWSAPSIQAFQALRNGLKNALCMPQIFVANIDDLKKSDELKDVEKLCEGKGEVFWILGGKAVRWMSLSKHDAVTAAVKYTQEFIKGNRG